MTHLHVTDLPHFTSLKHKTRSPVFLIFKWNYSGGRNWFNLFGGQLDNNTSPNFRSAYLWTQGFDFQESVLQKSLHEYEKIYLVVKICLLQHYREKLQKERQQQDCQLTGDWMKRVRWIQMFLFWETFKTPGQRKGEAPDHTHSTMTCIFKNTRPVSIYTYRYVHVFIQTCLHTHIYVSMSIAYPATFVSVSVTVSLCRFM